MQVNKFIKYLLSILIIANFTIFNKAIAQLQTSDAFTGAVKRDVLPSNLPKTNFIFNPDIQTTPNIPASPNGVNAITDGQDVRIFPSANVQAEVHISINKLNPNNLVASANTYLPTTTYNQGYYYTLDGGNTWNGADQLQNNPGLLFGDPSTAFSADGRAHITTIDPVAGYLAQNSTNGGLTWSNLISGTNQASFDKEMIAADNLPTSPFANNVYCAWSILQSNVGPYFVNFNRSINNGASFTAPITLKPNNGLGQGTNVQTGPNGEVYVCWADYDVDGTNKVTFPSHGLGFCSSTNGGVSFAAYRRVLNYTGIRASNGTDPLFNNIGVNDFPSMAVDKSNSIHRGRIYVVLPIKENGNGKAVIGFTFSDNQGATWSTPTTISIPTGRQNWFPWITVDDCSGDVWATYYSFDTPSGFTTNTYVTHSIDGGTTWESQRVSDVSHTTAPINDAIFRTGYAGDYIGITAFGGRAYPIWMDNRNGTWQLYCSPVTSNLNSYSISGDNIFCTTSTNYTIPNLPTGATVVWSVTPSGIATPNSPNSTQTTLTKNASGVITLDAIVSNACGQTITVTKPNISVGKPQPGPITFVLIDPALGKIQAMVDPVPGATSYNWYKNGVLQTISHGAAIQFPIARNVCNVYYDISVEAINSCGTSLRTHGEAYVPPCNNVFAVSPNPASASINVAPAAGNAQLSANTTIDEIRIYDLRGNLKIYQKFHKVQSALINISGLTSGTYFVEITDGSYNERQQIIIQQ